ncbi:hypothetical protein ILUMI_24339 [Ignelater luminosus]|uniref:FGFR1 oncogene partner (FOP) N-terminal dimerisation domain-containing protein n=1 Tax=Ignelater luminosus TaxID=2038154 RepID=A0A8K0CC60_IGNLU|nr:hypothetical protein ILUMI_24339 [Ignelater luminosus]
MSTEEDFELRDVVAQTLETNGCLPKIRAELRASIFLALDEDEDVQKQEPLLNKKVKAQLDTQEGRTMFCIVREFLEFFNLDYTISVYEPESYLGTNYQYEGRSKIIEDLGITQLKDNTTTPLLLQLIQIAQVKNVAQTKNIDINLSKIHNEGYCIAENEFTNSSTRNKSKTEIKDKSTSVSEDLEHSLNSGNSKQSSINGILDPIHTNLNETFNVSSPSINHSENQTDQNTKLKSPVEIILMDSTKSMNEEKDDTYDGTSSIAEDSVRDVPSGDLDKSVQNSPSETEFSPPILKDSKSHSKFDTSFDKLKLSPQKTEKIKAKSSLSSLADLPPLQLNKSRNDTVLLPSLYSKEFKEKTSNQNLKELDKFFDVDVDSLDNYEEDFMSESELNLNNKSTDNLKNSLLEELQSSSITDSNKNISFKNVSYSGKCLNMQNNQNVDFDNQSTDKNKTEELSPKNTNGIKGNDNSGTNSIASDETNLNVDDILNSPTSN